MSTATYDLIATTTLAASAPQVVFGSIPNTFRDLVLVIQANQASGSAQALRLSINGGTTTDGFTVFMNGNGSIAQSYTSASLNIGDLVAGTGQIHRVQIMDYSATDKHKTYLARFDRADYATLAIAGRWPYTNAITSVAVIPDSGVSFASGATFALYGIRS